MQTVIVMAHTETELTLMERINCVRGGGINSSMLLYQFVNLSVGSVSKSMQFVLYMCMATKQPSLHIGLASDIWTIA